MRRGRGRLAWPAGCPACASIALVVALPLALWLFVPVLSDGAPLSSKIEREAPPDRAQEGPRARPHDDDLGLHEADQRAAGRHHARCRRGRSGSRPTSTRKRAELARMQDDAARGAHPPRPAARAARRGARRAERPARRALQGRQARRRHRDPRGRRLRRPARAHGVHAARLRAGRPHHRPRPHGQGRGGRDRAAARRARGAPARGHRAWSPRRRQEVVASRSTLVDAARGVRRACADQKPRRSPARATSATTSRATCARSRRSRRAVLARLQAAQGGSGAPAGPIRQGSGSMIWPVNGPVVSPFGMRWGRLHAGVDIAVPAGTPIRAADSGTRRAARLDRRLRQLHLHRPRRRRSRRATRTSRATATSMGASVSKGQVIGYVGCTGHCFGDHLHFEVARQRRRRSTRWATSSEPVVPCSRCSRRSTSAR